MRAVVDRHAENSLYHHVANLLRNRIGSQRLPDGTELPSEASIARELGVGRDTVRHALAVLVHEGLIETKRGRPAAVCCRAPQTEVAIPTGAVVTARMPTPEERHRLELSPGVR